MSEKPVTLPGRAPNLVRHARPSGVPAQAHAARAFGADYVANIPRQPTTGDRSASIHSGRQERREITPSGRVYPRSGTFVRIDDTDIAHLGLAA
jgi:hypothetical protein